MGDPEAEVVLPRLTTNFTGVCTAILDGQLDRQPPLEVTGEHLRRRRRHPGADRGPPGWPFGTLGRGHHITGIADVDPQRCRIFHGSARALPDGRLVTDGGKCLNVVGRGDTPPEATRNAYEAIEKIHFEGIRYRTDIGITMPWD